MIEVSTFTATIFIAGDLDKARDVCRQFCHNEGECVTVEPCEYIYTGGSEMGVRVGFINYPRFPRTPAEIWENALILAERLQARLCQHSWSIVATDKTVWHTTRTAP